MSLKQKDTQTKKIDIAVFAVIFAFFLYSLGLFHKNVPSVPVTAETPKTITRELEPSASAAARSLASSAIPRPETAQFLRVGCLPLRGGSKFPTDAAMVRLNVDLCFAKGRAPAQISGRNRSTKENVLFFPLPEDKKITTNYIQLQEGKNIIELEYIVGKKKELEVIEIVRTDPK